MEDILEAIISDTRPKPTLQYNKAKTIHITQLSSGLTPGEIGNVHK